jgi:hypothetical protein
MILKDLCLFHIFYFLPFRRKLTNCWHFLLFLECLPMLASLPLQRLSCSWLTPVAGLPTAICNPVASVTLLMSLANLLLMVSQVLLASLLLIMFLVSLLLLASQLLQVSLLTATPFPAVAGIPADVHVHDDVVSAIVLPIYTCCFWLLIRKTCVAGLPAIVGIPVIASMPAVAGIPVFQISLLLLAFLLLLASLLLLGLCSFLAEPCCCCCMDSGH